MITFQQVSKHFGTQEVLIDAGFQINPGERIGIVGPNGAGKSTIFSLIMGEITPDKGEVITPNDCRIGYVHQQLHGHAVAATVLEYVENAVPELQTIQTEIHELEEALHKTAQIGAPVVGTATDVAPSPEQREQTLRLRRLGELQTRFEHLGGYTLKNQAERTLGGLGFPMEWLNDPFRTLSGGWQSRAELARVLVCAPDILLLDEPSNYLDIPAIEWLQGYLQEFRGTLLLISHDRFLLNSLTTATIEIANTRAERYAGNYDYYVREHAQRHTQREAAWKNQQRKREQLERFIERFKAKNTKAAQAQSRMKQLARMEEIELIPVVSSPGRLRLRHPPHCGAEVVRMENAGLTYDNERWLFRGLDLSISRGEKLALIGYNGMGKTTLLRMLAGNLAPSEGKRVLGHKVLIGYQSQDFAETMDPHQSVFGTIKSVAGNATDQEIRTMLGSFGFPGDAIEKQVAILSGGEKIRLAFARLLMCPPNFLVLDEPTTHLDIQAREALENALQDYQGTICLVSHDIDFVRKVATGIITITPPGVTRYAGGYDYYHGKMLEKLAANSQKSEVSNQKSVIRSQMEAAGNQRVENGKAVPDKKELRKQRAVERQALYDKTKDLKKEIQRLEQRIEECEAARTYLLKQLTGDTATIDFASLNKRLRSAEDEIGDYTRRWDAATESLDAAQRGAANETEDGSAAS